MPQRKLHRALEAARTSKTHIVFVCRNYVMSSFIFSELFYGIRVKNRWTVKTRTAFSLTKPIWILGKCFKHRSEEDVDERLPGLDMVKSQAMELFKREFSSRIWLTYRREFPQLAGSSYTTDCGWGCMLRSGQMMLAQALVQHFLGRDWNYYSEQTVQEQRYHHEIVRWFGDQPDDMSPFSLHRLVEIGKSSGKKAGDWYGPASVAHIFKEAMDQAMDLNPLLEQVCVYVAQDCTIYKADVINLCKRKRPGSLQPVFSDHSSPSTPQSPPVSPLRSSTHQLPVGPHLPAVIDTLSSSAVVRDTGSGPPAVEQEKGPKLSPPRRVQQSCQTDFESISELNGHPVAAVLPSGTRPTNANQAHSSTEPSLARPRKLPTVGSPPSVAPKPKTAHQSRWKGNSPKAQEPPSRSQVEAVKNCIELDDVTHHSNGKPARTSLVAESGKPQKGDDASSTWCASVILVPVRLGGDEVNPIYISSVQALFTLDCCIGIIGGKPKHSLYFVGYQEEKLIHLDPHYCQPVVDMKSREFSLSSFHCMSPRKMAINKMDPSCTIGFYLRTEEDFNQFCEIVPDIVQNSTTRQCSSDYPMFILREGSCHDWNSQHQTDPEKPERYLRVRHFNQNGQLIAPVRETDDFVFLDS
ncbi:cysteine protease ATG4D-like isoform X2 [Acanthaster planci]|uniref:Cysteine protease n=1 Tax=Acanthaster planci TaxID=133434 RepID=A0A8B7YII7_ACAPL|nr:cysteine protease ATG4D-like isoform X2 [Acanthaster planci]